MCQQVTTVTSGKWHNQSSVNVKRRLQYKSSALSLNVRPYKILQAANWLATNSTLYREQGISFSEDRISSYNVNFPES